MTKSWSDWKRELIGVSNLHSLFSFLIYGDLMKTKPFGKIIRICIKRVMLWKNGNGCFIEDEKGRSYVLVCENGTPPEVNKWYEAEARYAFIFKRQSLSCLMEVKK